MSRYEQTMATQSNGHENGQSLTVPTEREEQAHVWLTRATRDETLRPLKRKDEDWDALFQRLAAAYDAQCQQQRGWCDGTR